MAKQKRIPMDLTGQVFGRLTVTSEADPMYYLAHRRTGDVWQRQRRWHCSCTCGNTSIIRQIKLTTGRTKSCGCLVVDLGKSNARHGRSSDRIHANWCLILQRCTNPRNPSYKNYGGRGIQICERWLVFENFLEDMGERPSPSHSIERIDNNGHYCPDNCRWATPREQSRNTRQNRYITFDGITMVLTDWAARIGINRATLAWRLRRWPIEDALTKPPQR